MLRFVSGFDKRMRDSKFFKNSFQVRKFIALVDLLIFVIPLRLVYLDQSDKISSSMNIEL